MYKYQPNIFASKPGRPLETEANLESSSNDSAEDDPQRFMNNPEGSTNPKK
jgi:hypothetical protein